jgi:hypothetical protein
MPIIVGRLLSDPITAMVWSDERREFGQIQGQARTQINAIVVHYLLY